LQTPPSFVIESIRLHHPKHEFDWLIPSLLAVCNAPTVAPLYPPIQTWPHKKWWSGPAPALPSNVFLSTLAAWTLFASRAPPCKSCFHRLGLSLVWLLRKAKFEMAPHILSPACCEPCAHAPKSLPGLRWFQSQNRNAPAPARLRGQMNARTQSLSAPVPSAWNGFAAHRR